MPNKTQHTQINIRIIHKHIDIINWMVPGQNGIGTKTLF